MSMRRTLVLGAAVTALTLLGCGLGGADVDGDLADDWPALPQAQAFVPEKGCHALALEKNANREQAELVDCTTAHLSETIFVGQLSGAVAGVQDAPLATNGGLAPAYAECAGRANEAMGGPWLDFRLDLRLVLPTAAAWRGGSRWYACVLVEDKAIEDGTPKERTAPVSRTTVPRLGCFAGTGSGDVYLRETACTAAHNAEYAGSFVATAATAPLSTSEWDALHAKCRGIVASYLGTSIDRAKAKYGNIAGTVSDNWAAGERGVRCYLWLRNTKVSYSARYKGSTVPRYS
ncbi:MAG: hypothetical protein HOV79_32210 [Hamadaea sp.]|nr:hypothetical protein [Hamadaea sp.]